MGLEENTQVFTSDLSSTLQETSLGVPDTAGRRWFWGSSTSLPPPLGLPARGRLPRPDPVIDEFYRRDQTTAD